MSAVEHDGRFWTLWQHSFPASAELANSQEDLKGYKVHRYKVCYFFALEAQQASSEAGRGFLLAPFPSLLRNLLVLIL